MIHNTDMKSTFVLQEYIGIILEGDYREGRGWGGLFGYFFGGMQIQGKNNVSSVCNCMQKILGRCIHLISSNLKLDFRIQQVFVPITMVKHTQTKA